MSKDKLTQLVKTSTREIEAMTSALNKKVLKLLSIGFSKTQVRDKLKEDMGDAISYAETGRIVSRCEQALLEYNKENVELVAAKIYNQFWHQYREACADGNAAVAANILEKIAKFKGLDKQEVTINHNLNNFDGVPSETLTKLLRESTES